jgi:hypothetical protein
VRGRPGRRKPDDPLDSFGLWESACGLPRFPMDPPFWLSMPARAIVRWDASLFRLWHNSRVPFGTWIRAAAKRLKLTIEYAAAHLTRAARGNASGMKHGGNPLLR